MIFLESHSKDAAFYFGLEYELMTEHVLEEPVFLFWQTTPALMLGRFQNAYAEINFPWAKSHGIRILRRMSGGGTIYTDEGSFEYTFILPSTDNEIHFQRFMKPVIDAIRQLGVPDITFNGRNDLVIGGRKISGSAQYILNGRVLHHGSLLFDTDLDAMEQSTKVDTSKIHAKGMKSVRERVTNIADHLPAAMTREAFRDFMIQNILKDGRRCALTPRMQNRAEEIGKSRFSGYGNVFVQNPACEFARRRKFSGGTAEVRYSVSHGVISEAAIYGDFFGMLDTGDLCRSLIGTRYTEPDIRKAVMNFHPDQQLYHISREELCSLFLPDTSGK